MVNTLYSKKRLKYICVQNRINSTIMLPASHAENKTEDFIFNEVLQSPGKAHLLILNLWKKSFCIGWLRLISISTHIYFFGFVCRFLHLKPVLKIKGFFLIKSVNKIGKVKRPLCRLFKLSNTKNINKLINYNYNYKK